MDGDFPFVWRRSWTSSKGPRGILSILPYEPPEKAATFTNAANLAVPNKHIHIIVRNEKVNDVKQLFQHLKTLDSKFRMAFKAIKRTVIKLTEHAIMDTLTAGTYDVFLSQVES